MIDHGIGNQGFVGDEHFRAIHAFEYGIAGGDLGDIAGAVINRYAVANPHRVSSKIIKAGYIVTGHLLQAKAQAHAQRATKDR